MSTLAELGEIAKANAFTSAWKGVKGNDILGLKQVKRSGEVHRKVAAHNASNVPTPASIDLGQRKKARYDQAKQVAAIRTGTVAAGTAGVGAAGAGAYGMGKRRQAQQTP